MIVDMLRWWYGPGWLQAVHRIRIWTYRMVRTFSVPLLAHTLFAPWRRIVSVGGRSFQAKLEAMFDNLISRCVGFVVRIAVLIFACITTGFAGLVAVLIAIGWPLLPLAFIYFAIRSVTG